MIGRLSTLSHRKPIHELDITLHHRKSFHHVAEKVHPTLWSELYAL